MEFNSLDAQRSLRGLYRKPAWRDGSKLPTATMMVACPAADRPAPNVSWPTLRPVGRRRGGLKVDRLSRSLLDFHKLIELFERHETTFVSITQSFNTTDAMGRMHLNIMLTFAQYEREVIGERIRDKVAASRKKGMWMGGWTPLGYEVRDRKLIIHPADAERVRSIFKRFVQLKSATLLAREQVLSGATNRYGQLLDKGVLYRLLNNRVYIGAAVHKGVSYPGEHEAIIDRRLWDQVHAILKQSPRKRAANARAQTPALLKGLLFGPDGAAMSPTHTRKGGRLYRYYISQSVMKRGTDACPIRQVPAAEIERIVIDQLRSLLQTPEVIVQTWRAARKTDKVASDVRAALLDFEPLWNELFGEQAGIVERWSNARPGPMVDSAAGRRAHLAVQRLRGAAGRQEAA